MESSQNTIDTQRDFQIAKLESFQLSIFQQVNQAKERLYKQNELKQSDLSKLFNGVVSELIALTSPKDFFDFLKQFEGDLNQQENTDNVVQANKQQEKIRVDGNEGHINLQFQKMREDFIEQFQGLKQEMQLQTNRQIQSIENAITQKLNHSGKIDNQAQNQLVSQQRNQDYDKNKIEYLKQKILDLQVRLNLGDRQSNLSFFSNHSNGSDYQKAYGEILNSLVEDLSRIEERERNSQIVYPNASSYDQEEQKQSENIILQDSKQSQKDIGTSSNGIVSTQIEDTGQNFLKNESSLGYEDPIFPLSNESAEQEINQLDDSSSYLVKMYETNESLDQSRLNQSLRQNNQNPKIVAQNIIYKNQDGNLIIGLHHKQSMLKHSETQITYALEINDIITSIFNYRNYLIFGLQQSKLMIISSLDYTIKAETYIKAKAMKFLIIPGQRFQYLFVFCQSGYIEAISLQTFAVLASFRHSSELDFSDAAPTSQANEYLLGFSHNKNNKYEKGMIASIIITIRELNAEDVLIKFDEIKYSKVQVQGYKTKQSPIFCFAETFQKDLFVVCAFDINFKLYDHTQRKILPKTILNPSDSNNFNCLQRVCFFSSEYPYLIYKDSRSIGYIDCKSQIAYKVDDCSFQCSNNKYSLYQEKMPSDGQLELHSLWFKQDDKSKNDKQFKKIINLPAILDNKENLAN
ncbi:UNKNOWN [Stylonychia lemnae]|uniref:Uncharacterized protein n=1 Tax=Stylonychia lemnae TaxID=5949 RepID=A0A078A0W0_STYLE|nr:UNKNOWN [Stylonychia lemnae]|eukprot:CDW75113.1 UNKNOWN [Stylonychia lemnae]